MGHWVVPALGLAVLLGGVSAHAQSAAPSTAEERKQIVAVAKKLEQNPLDRSLTEDALRLSQRIVDVPDISVTLCTEVMPWVKEQYKYAPELAMVYIFGSAAHVIGHPESDAGTSSWAGIQAALHGYQEIVKQKPEAKSKAIDRAVEQESKGKLEKSVKEKCGPEKEGS